MQLRYVSAVLVFLALACDKSPPPAPVNPTGPTATVSALVAPPPPPPTEAPSIGVAECDTYFKFAFGCFARFPPNLRASSEAAIQKNLPGWRGLAATPANRDTLIKDCTAAHDALAKNPVCAPR